MSDISDWIGADSCDPGYQVLTDLDIAEQVTSTDTQPSTENELDSESEDSSSNIPTNGEAMEMLDKCLAWYECQSDATPTSIMLLKRIRDLAAKQRYASLKQLTLQSCLTTCKQLCMLITNVIYICTCTCTTLYHYCKLQYFTYLKISYTMYEMGLVPTISDMRGCTVYVYLCT